MTQTIQTTEERNEIVQEVIDRLLYLPKASRRQFIENLDIMFRVWNIEVKIVDGIRIYKPLNTQE